MPAPLVWGGLIVAGALGVGWAAKETEGALDSATKLMKISMVAGGLYVSYRALKSSGALK